MVKPKKDDLYKLEKMYLLELKDFEQTENQFLKRMFHGVKNKQN